MAKQLASGSAPANASHARSERQCPPVPKAAPWLVFPHGKGRKSQSFYNPCETENRNCIKSIPEMRGRAYYHKASHRGWLIVVGGVDGKAEHSVANSNLDDCFLWNPVSSETIQLPNLDRQSFPTKYKSKTYFLYDLVLSSPPPLQNSSSSDGEHGDDCTVFLLFRGVDAGGEVCNAEHILAFCRPGDKQWRTKELYRSCHQKNGGWSGYIASLVCFKGRLYAFGSSGERVREIRIKKLWHNVEVDKQTKYIRTVRIKEADFPTTQGGERFSGSMQHWLASGNEIFRVYFNFSLRSYRRVASIHILKLDFLSMAWVLLKKLDDHVLFLCTTNVGRLIKCNSTSSACCSTADMGLKRGCLFYTLPEDQTLYVYEVDDSATTIILPCLKLPTPWFPPTWIMMPTAVDKHVVAASTSVNDFLLSKDATESTSRMNRHSGEELQVSDTFNAYAGVEAIARFLHPVDYVHFRLACKRNSILLPALNRMSASPRTTATTYLSPWLVSIFGDGEETVWSFLDPLHNNDKYLMKVPDQLFVGATIHFSKDGWLVLSSGKGNVFFYNPLTRATIRLPDLPDDYTLGGVCFSSVPTSPDCVVIAISDWWPGVYKDSLISLLVTEMGKSATDWTIREFSYESKCEKEIMHEFVPCMNNPVFYRGDFYCLDYNGMLGVFSATGDSSWKVLSKSLEKFNAIYPSYLVECGNKLLLVNVGHNGKSTGVYRLDESKMVWVELKTLGKYAVFVSHTSSFSVVAPRSCMENKIYFSRLYGERLLYYSLDTCRYHCVGSDQHSLQDFIYTKERSNCTWIEPNWSRESISHEPSDIMPSI